MTQDEAGWHVHLASPVAYHAASMAWAGDIIDHDGGFGLGEGELPILKENFETTKRLWREVYGEPHPADLPGSQRHMGICQGEGTHCRALCSGRDMGICQNENSCSARRTEATCYSSCKSKCACHTEQQARVAMETTLSRCLATRMSA